MEWTFRFVASHRLRSFWTVVPAGMTIKTIKWFHGSEKEFGSFIKSQTVVIPAAFLLLDGCPRELKTRVHKRLVQECSQQPHL